MFFLQPGVILNYCFLPPLPPQDYDLCDTCKEQIGHVHEMDRIDGHDVDDRLPPNHVQQADQDVDNGTVSSDFPTNVDTHPQSIEYYNQALQHAYLCPDIYCPAYLCYKMKGALRHMKFCTARSDACRTCRLVKTICLYHAKACQNLNCPYAFCGHIKMKLQEQQQLHRQRWV